MQYVLWTTLNILRDCTAAVGVQLSKTVRIRKISGVRSEDRTAEELYMFPLALV